MSNKKIFFLAAIILFGMNSRISALEATSAPLNVDSLIKIFSSIWPNGNCADNISGSGKQIQITYACKDNFSAHQRNMFLDSLLNYGLKLQKETYRIETNSASYFYKFEAGDQNLYIKLFFRNPVVVWPLHENQRPKIAVFLNNVKSPVALEKWINIKLPLSISISVFEKDYDKIIQVGRESGYDLWVYYSGVLNPLTKGTEDLDKLALELKKFPEENFPFSGLTLPFSSDSYKDTQSLRLLLKSMKKNGLHKLLAPKTLEVIDTSRILGTISITASFDLSVVKEDQETIWNDALDCAKKYGYSVIVLNADDSDTMNFLLKKIEDNLDYVDYVNLSRLPIPENPLSRQ